MDFAKQEIEEIRGAWQREIDEAKRELSGLPKGYLIKRQMNNRVFFYHEENNKRYGITNDTELVEQLVHKRYLLELVKRLDSNIRHVDRLLKCYVSLSPSTIKDSLPSTYTGFFLGQLVGWKNTWGEETFETNPHYPKQCVFAASNGAMVRSKSELVIANMLELNHIHFRYEAKLEIHEHVFYPDFTIKRGNGDIIFWEHLGLMDQADYAKRTRKKLNLYAENGILPWKNLICTYEEDFQDAKRIRQIIDLI